MKGQSLVVSSPSRGHKWRCDECRRLQLQCPPALLELQTSRYLHQKLLPMHTLLRFRHISGSRYAPSRARIIMIIISTNACYYYHYHLISCFLTPLPFDAALSPRIALREQYGPRPSWGRVHVTCEASFSSLCPCD
jgi:hypothetical protein